MTSGREGSVYGLPISSSCSMWYIQQRKAEKSKKSKDVFVTDIERIANAAIATWRLNRIVLKEAKYGQDVGIAAAGALAWHALKD